MPASSASAVRPLTSVTDRELALKNALRRVFLSSAQLLCSWHIAKNVLARATRTWRRGTAEPGEVEAARKGFMAAFYAMADAWTVAEAEGRWADLQETYHHQPGLLKYIDDQWWVYKEQWVAGWTKRFVHLGGRTTSRSRGPTPGSRRT